MQVHHPKRTESLLFFLGHFLLFGVARAVGVDDSSALSRSRDSRRRTVYDDLAWYLFFFFFWRASLRSPPLANYVDKKDHGRDNCVFSLATTNLVSMAARFGGAHRGAYPPSGSAPVRRHSAPPCGRMYR